MFDSKEEKKYILHAFLFYLSMLKPKNIEVNTYNSIWCEIKKEKKRKEGDKTENSERK